LGQNVILGLSIGAIFGFSSTKTIGERNSRLNTKLNDGENSEFKRILTAKNMTEKCSVYQILIFPFYLLTKRPPVQRKSRLFHLGIGPVIGVYSLAK